MKISKVRTIEGIMQMRFEEVYEDFNRSKLTTQEASELLGISVRTFLRKRERYEEEGFDGQFDRRFGKPSWRKGIDEEMQRICGLYKSRYRGFNVRHFYEFAVREHGVRYSYTWVKNSLQKASLITKIKRKGPHRLKRERRPMEGMMTHQDGSTHRWIEALGYHIDLIVTMDDATSKITSAFFVEQEGTDSSFRGIQETIESYGLFCSFYTDRGSHYWHTPEAGGKVDKTQLTEVGRALKQLGIHHIAAYSPQARGRSERMFGTLQNRLPKELELQQITTIEEANRYLKEVFLPRHNAQFSVAAKEEKTAWMPWLHSVDLKEILCHIEERTVQNDNTVLYRGLKLQIPGDHWRHHYVKSKVQIRHYLDQSIGVFYGPRPLATYNQKGEKNYDHSTNTQRVMP